MSALKFGDPISLMKRDEARIKAEILECFPPHAIARLIDDVEEIMGFMPSGTQRKELHDAILQWLAKYYEP